jgi:hypothetical protein
VVRLTRADTAGEHHPRLVLRSVPHVVVHPAGRIAAAPPKLIIILLEIKGRISNMSSRLLFQTNKH